MKPDHVFYAYYFWRINFMILCVRVLFYLYVIFIFFMITSEENFLIYEYCCFLSFHVLRVPA